MTKKTASDTDREPAERRPYTVRLPGFIKDEDIGLGDVVARATSTLGIQYCGGCARRATALNRWLVFAGRRSQ
jgi:hypothetical protein